MIAYATNLIAKKQADGEKQEIRHELAVQLAKSLEQSNEKLNHWIEKYEDLSNKYHELRQRGSVGTSSKRPISAAGAGGGTGYVAGGGTAAAAPEPADAPEPTKARAADVAGTWKTPDGTVVWSFTNGRLQVKSTDLLPGMLSGSGSYRQTGGTVQGTVDLDVAFFLPVNQRMQFSGQVLDDGRIIAGTTTDPQGTVSAISLQR